MGSGLQPVFSLLLSAMLSPHCFNTTADTQKHTHTQTHTDTEHSMVKSLSEIRLTSSVYLTSFEEARVQTHTAHTHTHQTVPLIGRLCH